jgi:hypothetical protein
MVTRISGNCPNVERHVRLAAAQRHGFIEPLFLGNGGQIDDGQMEVVAAGYFLHEFAVLVHQIVFDGWSIRNLAHEFGTIAAALDAKRLHDLPEPPLQYGDYCLWQKEYFASSL